MQTLTSLYLKAENLRGFCGVPHAEVPPLYRKADLGGGGRGGGRFHGIYHENCCPKIRKIMNKIPVRLGVNAFTTLATLDADEFT